MYNKGLGLVANLGKSTVDILQKKIVTEHGFTHVHKGNFWSL